MLADMAIGIESSRLTVLRAACQIDQVLYFGVYTKYITEAFFAWCWGQEDNTIFASFTIIDWSMSFQCFILIQGIRNTYYASIAKCLAGDVANKCAADAVQVSKIAITQS